MIGFSLDSDATKRALEKYVRDLGQAAQESLTAGALAAQLSARATIHATTQRRTGDAEDNWGTAWVGPYSLRLRSGSDHTGFIESGTRAHLITARRATFLRFQVGGTTMFRRSVNHPGTRARPFMALAMAAGQMAMKATATRNIDNMAREF